ncbi:MAG TPA: GNAT family N-acetyltransferase [Longimicrobium sp.]|jgi:GNAT superfamily N-acetyltransferase|uniref:GNAT family N-acetyltransferase n=1 Tax=Longimicrobium sp. TaxID=2029185 RepID=UPI002EDB837A
MHNDPFAIRPALPADLDAVSDLLEAQLREHDIPIARADLEFAVDGVLRVPDRGFILCAEHDGAMVGVSNVSFIWRVEHGGAVAWLDDLYVRPGLRNAGVGRALLAATLDHARQAGCVAVELEVEASHADAERLYQRFGFEPLSRRRWLHALR